MSIGVLFDLDGTLLDTLEDLKNATNATLRSFGCPERSLEEVRQFVGNGAGVLMKKALPGKTTDPDWQTALDAFHTYYDAHCREKTGPYPGVPEMLAELQKRYPVAIVSNKPDSAVKQLCAYYFPGIFARGEDADCPRKPAPDMLYQAMRAVGADGCIYVGDSDVDIATAKNAGVPCLSVLWGFRDRDFLTASGATHFCADHRDLPVMIEKMETEYGK